MIPLLLLAAHFIGDFILQSDRMAINKSKDWGWLSAHCYVYSLVVGALAGSYLGVNGFAFVGLTFATHFVTDAVTSRITSKLWFMEPYDSSNTWIVKDPNTRHWFFVVIGFDQFIHYVTLAWTLKLLHN